jgi:tRNA threonylcarbamoyladenosine biosynthesis protein TsaE
MPRFEVPADGDLAPVAMSVCAGLSPGDIVYLEGVIGAGKTTLVQACARQLGVTEPVTSPTFALAHRYTGQTTIAHLDLYRLADQPGRDVGDLKDYLAEDAYAFVEWPELGASWLPPATGIVSITLLPDGGRSFSIDEPRP